MNDAAQPPELLVKGKRYSIEVQRGSGVLGVILSGVVDEETNFDVLLQEATRGSVRQMDFHVLNVAKINSVGVRGWLLFLEKLKEKVGVKFTILSQVFVEHANLASNMLGDEPHAVVAFQVPYFCPKCLSRVSVVLKSAEMMLPGGTVKAAPRYKCPKCADVLELDYPEEEYFYFLRRCQPPVPQPD